MSAYNMLLPPHCYIIQVPVLSLVVYLHHQRSWQLPSNEKGLPHQSLWQQLLLCRLHPPLPTRQTGITCSASFVVSVSSWRRNQAITQRRRSSQTSSSLAAVEVQCMCYTLLVPLHNLIVYPHRIIVNNYGNFRRKVCIFTAMYKSRKHLKILCLCTINVYNYVVQARNNVVWRFHNIMDICYFVNKGVSIFIFASHSS